MSRATIILAILLFIGSSEHSTVEEAKALLETGGEIALRGHQPPVTARVPITTFINVQGAFKGEPRNEIKSIVSSGCFE